MIIRKIFALTAVLGFALLAIACSNEPTPGGTSQEGLAIPETTGRQPPPPRAAPGSKQGGESEKAGGQAPPPRPSGGGSK